ncbi:flagellum-specific peptidoglycan hydrolase FlgJ [Winogradskyella wandonensis]|uniref:Peptidoglycan hydrolase n=2 Tax=Winogradskyella TaxID=286104 RepID=A0A4R1KM32_9FLAO|nr:MULTISPECIES: glucosaminidase domain-containing protein [Winogradskyella]TCK65253.1 flagellum-specific peptidoglycan hydrolase FlgJ [Winogradskyella wandonensis]SHH02940.1 Flagellum-specific peptidoglycan hydrolase FlgJ [Winogradskyella jejuensis]
MKLRLFIIILSLLVVSCGSKKGVVTKKEKSKTKTEEVIIKDKPVEEKPTAPVTKSSRKRTSVDVYIDTYSAIAMSEMRTSKIPASITLAQGILESGSGNGRLAKEANNHFGIKCHGWKGEKIYHDDDRSQECFRKYKEASTSYKDHSDFLVGRKRYAGLFNLKPDDYKGWARGLRAAGYATDRKYPEKLISLIERYELYKYDAQVLDKSQDFGEPIKVAKEVMHTIVKGDTLYSLSRKYGIPVEEIKRKNNLKSNNLSIGQILKIN